MAGYLEQIPKQLAARRKAFNAARDNPALLPSCWAIVRSIANNIYEYMRNAVIGGCTFPDRPIAFSVEDATFLNFGATPRLLAADMAWIEAEKAGAAPPDLSAGGQLEAEAALKMRRRLAALAGVYGDDHAVTRVYNLEPWLQDMYRDRLDVDFAEDLQRQIDALAAYMDGVPRSIAATGLSPRLVKGVMDAFNLFKTITGSSHQLDREKMSFVDRRSYVNTVQKIELIMAKADQTLGSAVAGRSVVRELFTLWKDANYEMMGLTRRLRALWAGTGLDERIQELVDLFGALQQALNRCGEEARAPAPQLPVVRADDPELTPLTRGRVAEAFLSLTRFDPVAGGNSVLRVRELRKFGPLTVVVSPGAGQPRYCWEIRKLLTADDEDSGKSPRDTAELRERELDIDRRVRYPLNCLVVPIGADGGRIGEDLADAWLEYNQLAFGVGYTEFLDGAKAAAPNAFLPPEGKEVRDLPPTHARQALARLVDAFVRWARSGEEPNGAPGFDAFREFTLSRLREDDFIVPARHRPFLELYAEAGAKRRREMWKRILGPRFALDRQLVAVSALMKDWNAFREHLKLLPVADTRDNSNLTNGFNKTRDAGDPFAEHKASAFFAKFLTEQPDLKSALVAVESRVSIEVETLRTQSESLGRVFQYDQASATMLRRQASQIQEKRLAANAHIDQYLAGLMYALDGNLDAAESALAGCLGPKENGQGGEEPLPDEVGAEWFDERFQPREGKFEKRRVPGEDGPGTECFEYIHYNLGIVYLRMERFVEASMCFRGALDSVPPDQGHLCRLWAGRHLEAARERVKNASE